MQGTKNVTQPAPTNYAENAHISHVETFGNIPLAKFGHTSSLISKNRLIVFGGASGNVGNYAITNDTFSLVMKSNPLSFTWRKLESKDCQSALDWFLLLIPLDKGVIPCPRAAHACTSFEEN